MAAAHAGAAGAVGSEPPAPARPPRRRAGHPGLVTFAKFALICCAVLLALLVAVWPEFEADTDPILSGLAGLDAAGRHEAVNPRLTGIDSRNRRFFVTADVVVQVAGDVEGFRFERPRASMALEDGGWTELSALRGMYWRADEKFHLSGGVELTSDRGHEIRTSHAVIDFAANAANGDAPVRGSGPLGAIEAAGFGIRDGGAKVTFQGPAHLVIDPHASASEGAR